VIGDSAVQHCARQPKNLRKLNVKAREASSNLCTVNVTKAQITRAMATLKPFYNTRARLKLKPTGVSSNLAINAAMTTRVMVMAVKNVGQAAFVHAKADRWVFPR